MPIVGLLILIALLFQFRSNAQLCNGSLGDNIFLDGDFGKAGNPIFQTNPMIAPGYAYSTGLVIDGAYSIVTSTANWSNLYPSWVKTGDNSGTSNGYMMVVNASYNPGVFYEKIITGLCGNTTYEFSADIINLILVGWQNHIDPNVAFSLDGAIKYTTGDIPKTNRWNTYGFTFTTAPAQTSIKLTLSNNAPGGIGNDLGLDNITFRPCGPSAFIGVSADKTEFLCIDDDPFKIQASVTNGLKNQFLWQTSQDNTIWTDVAKGQIESIIHDRFVPGDYYYRYYSAGDEFSIDNGKCRVLSDVVHIKVLPLTYSVNDTICESNFYTLGNKKIFMQGNYIDTLTSSRGCDSVVYLDLHVTPDPKINLLYLTTDPSCFDYVDGSIFVSSIANGNPPYQWYINNIQHGQSIEKLKAQNYILTIRDRFQCRDSFTIVLNNPDKLKLESIQDTTVYLGDEIALALNANYDLSSVKWLPTQYFSCQDCKDNIATPTMTSKISVVATTNQNCIDSLHFNIVVNKDKTFFLSNVLNPESVINGFFILYSYKAAVAKINHFSLYDRSGSLIHHLSNAIVVENPLKLWDGTFNGKYVETGVYTYGLEVTLLDNTVVNTYGNVTVVR